MVDQPQVFSPPLDPATASGAAGPRPALPDRSLERIGELAAFFGLVNAGAAVVLFFADEARAARRRPARGDDTTRDRVGTVEARVGNRRLSMAIEFQRRAARPEGAPERPSLRDEPATGDMPTPLPGARLRRLPAVFAVTACLGATLGVGTLVGIAGAAPRQCTSGRPTHLVGDGDTWFGIAAEAQVSMAAVLEANGAAVDDVIHPGDEVCLPEGAAPTSGSSGGNAGCTASAAAYTVARGDSWFQIARRTGTTMRELLEVNGADANVTLQPDDRLCLPPGARPVADANAVVALDALPVQGPCWYGDTWRAPRGGERRHEGVDLIVESGKYVYAVADGVLTKRAWDQPGLRAGNAWWLTTADGTYFFYAHMSDFAPGLKVGSRVRAGQIIGFVGSTGNSATAHLHFEIHPFGGDAINPYPSVRAAGGCRTGAGYTQPNGWTPD